MVKCLVGVLLSVVLQEQHAAAAVMAIIGIGVGLATIAVEDILVMLPWVNKGIS